LNLVLNQGLNFSFFFGAVSVSSSPDDVMISMVTPGSPGAIADNTFDQLANSLALAGILDISDRFGLVQIGRGRSKV